jgi:hypothetical protein
MALVQMRTPGGSYSMVDEKLVRVYEAEGWVLTSELPEFKTKNVTYYDEARKTVTTTKGEEKPVEEVINEPQMGFREERKTVTTTLSERAQRSRDYTADEWQALLNAPIEEKLEIIKQNAANGMRLTSSQKYFLDKQYNVEAKKINTAQDEGKAGKTETPQSGPLKPGEAGYGIDTWYEFLGYRSEDDAMRDFIKGDLTRAEIRRAEAEIQPDPADIIVDLDKVKTTYGVADSDWARVTPSGQKYVSLLESIEALENSAFGQTPPGQAVINDLKSGTDKDITVTGGGTGNPNLGSGTSSEEVVTTGECPPGYRFDEASQSCVLIDDGEPSDGGPGDGGPVGESMSTKYNQFNNIPEGALLAQTDADKLYLMYEVPGQGTLFQGKPIWIFYEVKDNDLYEAGILTPGAPYEINMMLTEEQIDGFVYGGNTADLPGNDPRTGRAPHPFTSFVENVSTQAQIAPWILDIDSVKLLAEAALEGREVTEAEWRMTNWYQTHSEAEREWQRLYYADPTTAQNTVNDYKIQVSRALQAAGVTGGFDPETGMERAVPDALAGWIANKWVSGQWTESYTTEQLALFADPFRSGVRDVELGNYIATAGVDGLERTAEQEDRVRQLYTQWLGPVFGKLTDQEVAQQAGRIRNDPDFEQALIEQLKNNRLALFPQYTNPELTYNDIATPWRNLTTSVWGKAADETQSWWQDMVATNNFTEGTATLRSKGLEQNVDQVTIEATEALQKALGQGSQVVDLGVNR